MAKYTKFGSPEPEDSAPKASTSKLVSTSSQLPPPPSSSSLPAPSPSKKRPRSPSLTNGSINGNGKAHHNHTVSYHQSDEEDELASKHQRQQQPLSKKKRRREGSLTNGAGVAGGDTAAEKDKRRAVAEKLRKERMELPIWAGQDAIKKAVMENDTVVILGETGSGKTTQVPQFLLQLPTLFPMKIAITQPRRVAALTLATRVAAEQGTSVGARVGHSVRFDTKVGALTKLVYLTDGMLVRELLVDADLSRYGAIIVDEAHERNVSTDLLLGSLKRIQRTRNSKTPDSDGNLPNPLKVIIMSATLDAERFSDFFGKAPILYVRGRQHTVKIYNTLSMPEDYQEAAVKTFFQVHSTQPAGDVLIFLTGQEDIDNVHQQIKALAAQLPPNGLAVSIHPFMASTLGTQQTKIFEPAAPRTRKVILATNVAETSITIPGIKYVIDTGLCKEKNYLNRRGTGIETLEVKQISRSAAQQRTGRAGREGPGFCYRLFTEKSFKQMVPSPKPEILRTNLAQVVLQLKELGIKDLDEFEFLDSPDPNFLGESLMILFGLGAIDEKTAMTPLGHSMLKYPLDPVRSKILLASIARECTLDILDILSLSIESPIFMEPPSTTDRDEVAQARAAFTHRDGDHMTMLNVLRSYEAVPRSDAKGRKEWCKARWVNERGLKKAILARDQMRGICEKEGVDWRVTSGDDSEPILRSLVDGLFTNTAILRDGEYKQLVGSSIVKIHPSSVLHSKRAPAIIYDEIVHTKSTYARNVSSVQFAWLQDQAMFGKRSA